jgi:hypothetical protein
MRRTAIALLAMGAVCIAAHAAGAPIARADRPLSDITCERGQRATYDRGERRFSDEALVVGCTRLADGGLLQIDAGRQERDSPSTCLWLTFGPPRSNGLFACAHQLPSEPRVLLILRHRSKLPYLVFGVAPAGAERVVVERVVVSYSGAEGPPQRARAHVIRTGDRLARSVGASAAFGAFVAELGPAVEICKGVEPLVLGSMPPTSRGRLAAPSKHPLGRPDGWLAGFAPSYGVGYGPQAVPTVCDDAQEATPRNQRPSGSGGSATGGMPWPLATGAAAGLALVGLLALRRFKARSTAG